MSISEDLINFEVIEDQKENIQSLPGGHSARALASIFSPSPFKSPTPSDTKSHNDVTRQEFESEIENISESEDPLDIYDRYVKWTLDAYPSAQATPSSQLLPLLERATRAFVNSMQYKNDPRYLKLWISYIRFVSDAPREAFSYLARHGIGEYLALFYEEFAAWLEGVGRRNQADEIYRLGIDKEARPMARLLRKYSEFQARLAQRPDDTSQPSSPALPTIRPALTTKVDPFTIVLPSDPQAVVPNPELRQTAKNKKPKLQIFSDKDNNNPDLVPQVDTIGWQSIGSLAERKKENKIEAKPWVGETLKAGSGKKTTKIAVYKDTSSPWRCVFQSQSQYTYPQITDPSEHQVTVNQKGRKECIFVDLEALYPTPEIFGSELSIEELRAYHRGWLSMTWETEDCNNMRIIDHSSSENSSNKISIVNDELIEAVAENFVIDEPLSKGVSHEGRGRRMKIREVNETQIIKAKLSSPSGPKMMKRKSKDQTMTLHTKAATDEIYDLFNQPLQIPEETVKEDEDSSDEDEMTDGDYTSGCELTINDNDFDETSNIKNANEWSEQSSKKHVPDLENEIECNEEIKSKDSIDDQVRNQKENIQPSTPLSSEFSTEDGFISLPNSSLTDEPPNHPYREPIQVTHNRLPFMTPIAEKTESSIGIETASKTPIKNTFNEHHHTEVNVSSRHTFEIHRHNIDNETVTKTFPKNSPPAKEAKYYPGKYEKEDTDYSMKITKKIAIIKDKQCNPTNHALHKSILSCIEPPLHVYEGYFDNSDVINARNPEIKKYLKTINRSHRKSAEKTINSPASPILRFPGTHRCYEIIRELGAGTFAPVYLIKSMLAEDKDNLGQSTSFRLQGSSLSMSENERNNLEALKMEHTPSAWEFYIMRQARYRLENSRAAASVIKVNEMHLYKDESYLIEEFREQGTLLNVINIAKEDKSGPAGMDESLAMFFSIELFRTIEELHAKGILHGDLKADNCLVRFDPIDDTETWSSCYRRDGSEGWIKKGISLIDFGRGIDMYVFNPDVQFIADWDSSPQDCAEIREMRPWTYQIDYHGLAGILHSMLFGKYIDTVSDTRSTCLGPGAKKTWRLRENLKRYWQVDIWAEAFDLLLNGASHIEGEEDCKMPITRSLKACREKMELWLEANTKKCINLQASIRKLENILARRK
ncbi:Checkpoint serine/threonine-protein kinase BUB1 [Golovinomyces cichoracearum]|uniref:Checkpoint serine/threonine-protein kinase BUB1 n=1 Tax=Golovinomyces cichoracearum TaxID=62708 RepID=A0A420HGT1_9PEZI|nr:Checkpoint serine/threonine-protein kinase BUB1 [Golovinomyces cichoracearum]